MKILIKQFLGQNHSWSVTGQNLANSLKKEHEVHLFPTDGLQHLPSNLKENVIGYTELNKPLDIKGRVPDIDYDCQISYTAMKNFPLYLKNGKSNRFGIWCYEWNGKNVLPNGFAANYIHCDKILAPSSFAKDIFINSGIPEKHIEIISHGINIPSNNKMILPTKKKVKIFANIAQNHIRKNISGLLEAYGKAFTNKDDICLVLKAKGKAVTQNFEVSLDNLIKEYKSKYNAELKLINNYINDISELYNSIDIVYTMSHCEGFYYPGLEGLAAGKLNIAPNYGGQLDFLNNTNSLLVSGQIKRAKPESMYWESKDNAEWFVPGIDDAVDKLKYAYSNYEKENAKLANNSQSIIKEYNWDNITNKILKIK